jgi:NAD(P)-dependent dehydrogenase (short-subunit alcohol dehydrogenase family)
VDSMFSLTEKVAIVTGAGRWTGKTIALELAKAGADVVICARSTEGIESAAAEIRSLGRRALAVPTDVRLSEQVDELARRTLDEFHKVDILVNNVGDIGGIIKPTLEMSEEEWDSMMIHNLKSTFLCSKAIARTMIERGGGSIINIASGEGVRHSVTNAGYAAAKAGVINLTMSLAVELAPHHIRVNAVAPGFIGSPDFRQYMERELLPPDLVALVSRIPLGRISTLQEIAGPVVFLASEAAGYMTGTTIAVDGGMMITMR